MRARHLPGVFGPPHLVEGEQAERDRGRYERAGEPLAVVRQKLSTTVEWYATLRRQARTLHNPTTAGLPQPRHTALLTY